MLDILFNDPLSFLSWALALLIAVTIHEFAHAWTADKLGDPTPRLADRLTLNPLAHLDPLGTLALLIARVGWGKPVPIDPYNLRNPRRDTALISLAGPASNLILIFLITFLAKLIFRFPMMLVSYSIYQPMALSTLYNAGEVAFSSYLIAKTVGALMILNVGLAIFNLLPVPPLDGAKILFGFLPVRWGVKLEESLSQYGIFLLIFLIFPFFGGASLVSYIIFPIINFILNLLL